MILILNKKPSKEEINQITNVYPNYTKLVVDIEKNIVAAGGEYHIDCEQVLLNNGSLQKDLWGGGFNFETKEIDYFGLTNFKSDQTNISYYE